MTDFLRPTLDSASIGKMSTLALAHLGDCVYELMTRSNLTCHGAVTSKTLHKSTVAVVKASAQAIGAAKILPVLTEEERAVFLRGRNAKPKTVPKSTSQAEYAYATALEALFGWLYLNARYDRLNALYTMVLSALEEKDKA